MDDVLEPVTIKPDYFAELYVAGVLALRGWNIYFPHRDEGFDFIISKEVGDEMLIRPVQVKGKYLEPEKTDKSVYGYVGDLSQFHPEMVLAIPYFRSSAKNETPVHIAYMPASQVKPHSRGRHCEPAKFEGGVPAPRRYYAKFFDEQGLRLLESKEFGTMRLTMTDKDYEDACK